jgi:acetylcholinesterase
MPSSRSAFRRRSLLTTILLLTFAVWVLSHIFRGSSSSPDSVDMGNRPSITLRQGTFVGDEVKVGFPQVMELFLGIPYALSPDGERRFALPVPVEDSDEVFDASSYGFRCAAGAAGGIPQSEDCLNLNIYRPKDRARSTHQKIPVIVYIHGGSFNSGFGASRPISNLVAWSPEPMIGVSFNYRVGAFGFLPSTWMKGEGGLNLGLRDQEAALLWVQKNIEMFGGDPKQVTIMGSSAGAHSVCVTSLHHLIPSLTFIVSFCNS